MTVIITNIEIERKNCDIYENKRKSERKWENSMEIEIGEWERYENIET